jgi:hypothetical protein
MLFPEGGATLLSIALNNIIYRMDEDPSDEPQSARGPIAALVVLVMLVLGGLWLTHRIGMMSSLQDCVSSGRTNCAPIKP